MKRRLIEALTYPRLFVLETIDPGNCPHDGLFEASDAQCHECGLKQQCHWLTCLNRFNDLASKPLHTVNASLLYSIDLIEAHVENFEHDTAICDCESCTWIREARQLAAEFSCKYAWSIDSSGGNGPNNTH